MKKLLVAVPVIAAALASLTVTAAPVAADVPIKVGLVGPSGVQASVPALAGHVEPGYARTGFGMTDSTGHDTGVAGIIVDIAPTATIVPVVRDWCAGLDYVVSRGATVVVIPMVTGQDVPCLRESVAKAIAADVVVVSGVGNDGVERRTPIYPADYPDVIGAGAVDAAEWRPAWANVGPAVDLVAPGDQVRVLTRDGGTTLASGTSYSAAYIAGVAAKIRATYPSWTAKQVVGHLVGTAKDLGASGRDWWFGDGLVRR
ncbi:MAG: S8 family serine peptidase [Actinomycetota bacterium]|nr:S8 family serine peptidase [Actinomycetota bacterium]